MADIYNGSMIGDTVSLINDTLTQSADPALTADNPLWLNILELSFSLPAILFATLSSCIVLLVVAINTNLHESPGILMVILSVIDLCIIHGDSSITVLQISRHLFGLQPYEKWAVCYVREKFRFFKVTFNKFVKVFVQVQFITNNYLYGMQSTAIMMCAVDQLIAIIKPITYLCFKAKVTRHLIYSLLVYWVCLVPMWVVPLCAKEEIIWVASFSGYAVKITNPQLMKSEPK